MMSEQGYACGWVGVSGEEMACLKVTCVVNSSGLSWFPRDCLCVRCGPCLFVTVCVFASVCLCAPGCWGAGDGVRGGWGA